MTQLSDSGPLLVPLASAVQNRSSYESAQSVLEQREQRLTSAVEFLSLILGAIWLVVFGLGVYGKLGEDVQLMCLYACLYTVGFAWLYTPVLLARCLEFAAERTVMKRVIETKNELDRAWFSSSTYQAEEAARRIRGRLEGHLRSARLEARRIQELPTQQARIFEEALAAREALAVDVTTLIDMLSEYESQLTEMRSNAQQDQFQRFNELFRAYSRTTTLIGWSAVTVSLSAAVVATYLTLLLR